MTGNLRVLGDLFAQAVELPLVERAEFVARKCAGSPQLREDLESLLQAHEESEASFNSRSAAVRDILGALGSSLLTGQKLASYQMGPIIGEGGMGIVYRALDTKRNAPVAVKVLPQELAFDSPWRKRFAREVRAMAAIQHPNVVRILDYGEDGGCLFLAMELIEGETLRAMLAGGPLPLERVLDHAIGIAAALEAAHRAGVIHHDLKPGNIMIGPGGVVKVVDFGLSRPVDDSNGSSSRTQLSQVGTPAGTIDYLSPEQAGGRPIDTRSDLFALGSVVYEMLTGTRPFHRSTNLETAAAILRDRPEPLPQSVPRPVARLVEKCLEKDVGKRAASAFEVRRELEALHARLGRGKLKPQRFPRTRRAVLWAIPAAVLVAAVALAGRTAWNGRASRPLHFQSLTDDPHVTNEPALSLDGRWLAYASDRAEDGNVDIWIQPTGQGTARRLTNHPAVDHQPALSPDGTRLAFRSEREPAGVYSMAVNQGAEQLLAAGGRDPQFSPDGKWIAYWSGPEITGDAVAAAQSAILVIPSAGGRPRRLAGEFHDARHPVWSPDARNLLFSGHRNGDDDAPEFWAAPLDGAAPRLKARWRSEAQNSVGPPQPIAWPEDEVALLRWYRLKTYPPSNQLWRLHFPARPETEEPATELITTRPGSYSGGTTDRTGRLVVASGAMRSSIWSVAVDPETGQPRGAVAPLVLEGQRQQLSSLTADGKRLLYSVTDARGASRYILQNLESGRQTVAGSGLLAMMMTRDGRWISVYGLATSVGARTFAIPGVGIRSFPMKLVMWDLSRDGKQALTASVTLPRSVELNSLDTPEPVPLLEHPSFNLYLANFSSDDRWVLVTAENGVAPPHLFAVPFDGSHPVPVSRWVDLGEGSFGYWAPSGKRVYFMRDHQGSRCIFTLALDPASKRPVGDATAVLHLHSAWRSPLQLEPGVFRLLAGPDKLVFSLGEAQSNLWLAER